MTSRLWRAVTLGVCAFLMPVAAFAHDGTDSEVDVASEFEVLSVNGGCL